MHVVFGTIDVVKDDTKADTYSGCISESSQVSANFCAKNRVALVLKMVNLIVVKLNNTKNKRNCENID